MTFPYTNLEIADFISSLDSANTQKDNQKNPKNYKDAQMKNPNQSNLQAKNNQGLQLPIPKKITLFLIKSSAFL